MNAQTEIIQTNNLDLAKQILSEGYEISAEIFWSLLFWKMPELFFLSVSKSTQISKEQLSNSLRRAILNDLDNTFDSIILILSKLNDLIEIQALIPNESHSSGDIALPNLREVIFLYSTIVYTIFPYFNEELSLRVSQGMQIFLILSRTKKVLINFNLTYKDFDRTTKKVSQMSEIKHGLLKGVLSGIANKITQVPIIQHFTFE